ncbi:hypothetical protein N8666_00620 [bacterium]|mgnify:FL=1|nr:hypothetical protein [bacterium]|tara:strand:+ start:1470 stop:2384 length:915 start_codon:yes stop_codon:yes gene_type:complete
MSKIFVDQVDPKTGTSLTLGTSGDTVNIPSGVTIANAGTATGFGVSLANGVDNRVVTSSSATALNGEANLTFSSGKNLGVGTASPNSFSGYSTVTIGGSNSTTGSGIDFENNSGTILARLFGDASGSQYGTASGLSHRFEVDGTQVMKIDGNGIVTKPLQPAFLALNHGSDSITNATETVIALDSEIFDANGDVSSNTFTAPVTGKYYLSSMVCLDAGSSSNSRFNRVYIEIVCSNRNARFEYGQNYTDEDDRMGVTGSFLVDMDANDTAQVKVSASRNGASGATTTVGNASNALTFFCGYLVA